MPSLADFQSRNLHDSDCVLIMNADVWMFSFMNVSFIFLFLLIFYYRYILIAHADLFPASIIRCEPSCCRIMAGGCWTLSTGPAATVRATIARLRKQQQGSDGHDF